MTILRCEYSFFPKMVGIFLGEVVQEMYERSARVVVVFFTIFRQKKVSKTEKKELSYFEELSGGLVVFSGA
jgi:hypothetical protein